MPNKQDAYVPGFEYDIFVSYAHVDNGVPGKEKKDKNDKGWVDFFDERLVFYLAQCEGRYGRIKVWRDSELDGTQVFNETIKRRILGSALFLAITSPGYRESKYCLKEFAAFHLKAQAEDAGLQIIDRYRIVNVRHRQLRRAKLPKKFRLTTGFPFYEKNGWPFDIKGKDFDSRIKDLVDAIYETLKAFREQEEKRSQDAIRKDQPKDRMVDSPSGDDGKFSLYFADVNDSLQIVRKRVVSEIDRKKTGLIIGPHIPPPLDAPRHKEKVKNALRSARLSVHLLGDTPGREIENDPDHYYPHEQAKFGLEHSRAQLIWVPEKLVLSEISDDYKEYRIFLKNIEEGTVDLGNRETDRLQYEFIRGGNPAALAEAILQKAEEVDEQSSSLVTRSDTLIDTHLKDYQYAAQLGAFLFERGISTHVVPHTDDTTGPTMNLYRETLKKVSILIIVFGEVEEKWVRERFGHALQLIVTEQCPVMSVYIYLVPPPKKVTADTFGQGSVFQAQLLDNSDVDQLDPERLQPLLEFLGDGAKDERQAAQGKGHPSDKGAGNE